ncbi:hypothetical protein IAD21_02329 [Abditibacteriota bacterium]|nr:hypothetical protein IAD21_02329 [Abditibacteriota bacterium]
MKYQILGCFFVLTFWVLADFNRALANNFHASYLIRAGQVKASLNFTEGGRYVVYRTYKGKTMTFYGRYRVNAGKIHVWVQPITGYVRVSKKQKMILREEDIYKIERNTLVPLMIKMHYSSFDGKKKGFLMTPTKDYPAIVKIK